MPMGCAPPADRVMRVVKLLVRPEMGRCGNEAWRSCRGDDFAVPAERVVEFDAHFQVDLAVPVDRHVPARTGHLLGAHDVPHGAAGIGDDLRELLGTRLAAYHG